MNAAATNSTISCLQGRSCENLEAFNRIRSMSFFSKAGIKNSNLTQGRKQIITGKVTMRMNQLMASKEIQNIKNL